MPFEVKLSTEMVDTMLYCLGVAFSESRGWSRDEAHLLNLRPVGGGCEMYTRVTQHIKHHKRPQTWYACDMEINNNLPTVE